MKIRFHKNFERRYKKLRASHKIRIKKRLSLFLKDEFNPLLNNHPLRGAYKSYRSINITGDIRAIYKKISLDTCVFIEIGRHNDLYK